MRTSTKILLIVGGFLIGRELRRSSDAKLEAWKAKKLQEREDLLKRLSPGKSSLGPLVIIQTTPSLEAEEARKAAEVEAKRREAQLLLRQEEARKAAEEAAKEAAKQRGALHSQRMTGAAEALALAQVNNLWPAMAPARGPFRVGDTVELLTLLGREPFSARITEVVEPGRYRGIVRSPPRSHELAESKPVTFDDRHVLRRLEVRTSQIRT